MSDFLTKEEAVEAYGSTSLIYLVYNFPREGYPDGFEFCYRARECQSPWMGPFLQDKTHHAKGSFVKAVTAQLASDEVQPTKIVVREYLGKPVSTELGDPEWLFNGLEDKELDPEHDTNFGIGIFDTPYISYGQTAYHDPDAAVAKAERISAEILGGIPHEKQLLGDDFRFPNPKYTRQGQVGYLATSDPLDPNGIQKFDVNVNFELFVHQKVPTSDEVSYSLVVRSCKGEKDFDHAVLDLEGLNGEWRNRETDETASTNKIKFGRPPTVFLFPDAESRDEYVAQISNGLFQQAVPHLSNEALLEELKQRGIDLIRRNLFFNARY